MKKLHIALLGMVPLMIAGCAAPRGGTADDFENADYGYTTGPAEIVREDGTMIKITDPAWPVHDARPRVHQYEPADRNRIQFPEVPRTVD
jgi:hypothetical protein